MISIKIFHNFLFPVTMCIYINTKFWLEHSFKVVVLHNFMKYFSGARVYEILNN